VLMEQYREYLDAELRHLDYAPIAFVTAKEGKNVQEVIDLSQHLYKQANLRIPTAKLNEAVQQIISERMPSFPGGRRAKIYYATQTDVAPPTIVMFVNQPEHVDESYRRFVVNRLRELLPFDEVPIRLEIRGRSGRNEDGDQTLDEASAARRPQRPRRVAASSVRPRAGKGKPQGRSSAKPHPKKAGRHGPPRGTRPK
jgi:GTP-binding protein